MLMQHYDRRGQYDIALSKIDEAINHTPTVIDLYSAKVCVDIFLRLNVYVLSLYSSAIAWLNDLLFYKNCLPSLCGLVVF